MTGPLSPRRPSRPPSAIPQSAARRTLSRAIWLIFTPRKPLRRLIGGLIVGLLVGGLLAFVLREDYFSGVRVRLQDALYRSRPTRGIVTLIAADDASLDAFGRTTAEWDRQVYIDLITVLAEGGARVIAFDLLFANPTEIDPVLADTMRAARNVVQPVVGIGEARLPAQPEDLITFNTFTHPTPDLEAAAMGLGHVNVIPDTDGFVRRIPLFVREGDRPVPALGLAAYLEYLRLLPEMVTFEDQWVRFAGRDLPVDDYGQMLVYYFGEPSHAGEPGTFPVYSLVDVVQGRVNPSMFEDQIVLIGVLDAAGLPDNFPVPGIRAGDQLYGVEIHANLIETLHQSLPQFQASVDWRLDLGIVEIPLYEGTTTFPLREQSRDGKILVVFVMALLGGAILPFFRWYWGVGLSLLAYLAFFFWASVSFTVDSMLVEIMYPSWALLLTYMGNLIVIYVFEERRRGQINDLFSRYVSTEIAHRIVEQFDRGRLELGGEEREITVLFADVRGFTTMVEGLPPAEVVRMLNIFLEEMNAIVLQHGGAINKYIGDNLMAFWNAPYPQPDHAWNAVQSGLDMLAAIERLNDTQQFVQPVQFGIGIDTGNVVVGNIGSQQRLEYTPIGDTVNIASRLSGVAPGGTCYIGQRTRDLVADRFTPADVHHLKLKGKREEVAVYELRPVADRIAAQVRGRGRA
ncbi:MAG: adenylate/guanylate cyclase domain-containing protein [Anaerolineae bacterium]|nr:adenylate/guanylate cyclase domain-containing protein [Anaerolineae bacterium]